MKIAVVGAGIFGITATIKLADRIRNIVVETHERFPILKLPTEELKRRIRLNGLKTLI